MSLSTIEFLNKQNSIDFNKWIKEGVEFYNQKQLSKIQYLIWNNSLDGMIPKKNFEILFLNEFDQISDAK